MCAVTQRRRGRDEIPKSKAEKIEVLEGNPSGDALYTVRLKFPANYKVPAHSHPKDEHVTVISGVL